MESIKVCPVCGAKTLKVLKRHEFRPNPVTGAAKLEPGVGVLDERLWIYFHKILGKAEAATVESTQCASCDFIFSNPRFTEEDIEVKYRTIEELGFDQERHRHRQMPDLSLRAQRIHQLVNRNLGDKHRKSLDILDYGGAEGHLLVPFIEAGHRGYLMDYVQYHLADPRIEYLGRELGDLPAGRQFDVILLLHTLEHVVDPVPLLRKLSTVLRPGGRLYVEVPLGAWLEWEFLREPVTHLNFFAESSLCRTVEAAGLHPLFVNSQWQLVTTYSIPCINLIATNEPVSNPVNPKKAARQMKGLTYYPGGIRHNFRYYTKIVLRHYLFSERSLANSRT